MDCIVTNPRPSRIGYRLAASRTELLYLEPGANVMDVAAAKAMRDAPFTASGRVGMPRQKRILSQGEWLAALGVTIAWPEPGAVDPPEADKPAPEAQARPASRVR